MKTRTKGTRTAGALLLAAAVALIALSGCETLTDIGTSVGVESGAISGEQADSIKRSAEAVARSFENFTPEQEYYIGRAVGANVVKKYRPSTDSEATDYLNTLGQSLAMASDRPETFSGYHFLILDSDEINAFAAPSGFIFVTKGMLRCTSSEDMLAAVLAHEIGHVQHDHGLQAIKKSRVTTAVTSVALTTAEVAGPKEVSELTVAFEGSITDITTTLMNNGYSRAFEREADNAAVTILGRVGYDPYALIDMLEVMDRRLDPKGLDFAKTHPDPQDRIADIRGMLEGVERKPSASAARDRRYGQAMAGL